MEKRVIYVVWYRFYKMPQNCFIAEFSPKKKIDEQKKQKRELVRSFMWILIKVVSMK
jgi:hypothetical protein